MEGVYTLKIVHTEENKHKVNTEECTHGGIYEEREDTNTERRYTQREVYAEERYTLKIGKRGGSYVRSEVYTEAGTYGGGYIRREIYSKGSTQKWELFTEGSFT